VNPGHEYVEIRHRRVHPDCLTYCGPRYRARRLLHGDTTLEWYGKSVRVALLLKCHVILLKQHFFSFALHRQASLIPDSYELLSSCGGHFF